MSSILIRQGGANASLDVFGPTIEFLTSPEQGDGSYCVMMGTVPRGIAVPLHSHPDLESFFLISGGLEVLSERGGRLEWQDVKCSEFVHIPSNAKHAWRNTSSAPSVMLITITPKLGRFFQEIGRPVTVGAFPGPPTPDELQHFARITAKYGYWIATPEENSDVGIDLSRLGLRP